VLQCVVVRYNLRQCVVEVYVYLSTLADSADIIRSTCCRLLQCVAMCCNVLHCVAMCCNMLQCVAMCCNVLQQVVVRCNLWLGVVEEHVYLSTLAIVPR